MFKLCSFSFSSFTFWHAYMLSLSDSISCSSRRLLCLLFSSSLCSSFFANSIYVADIMNKPPYPLPLCKHPVLILNQRALFLIRQHGYYFYKGVEYEGVNTGKSFEYNYGRWYKKARAFKTRYKHSDGNYYFKYDYEGLAQCYVQAGCRFEYLFLLVPCRHCPICVEHKRNDYVARCAFESQTSSTPPIMVTLTYEPKFLPHKIHFHHIHAFNRDDVFDKNTRHSQDWYDDKRFYKYETSVYYRDGDIRSFGDGDLFLDDVQLFLKRLRIRLERAGRVPRNMRYVCCGEYGSKHGRPHYHFLFWNVPFPIKSQHDFLYIDMFKSFCLQAWNMCIDDACKVEVARSAARYCTKYMTKVDKFGRKGFFLASRGSRGTSWKGIGSKFLAENKEFFLQHPTMQVIPFKDKWNGELSQYTFGSYALKKIFPSSSDYLSTGRFKHRFLELCFAGGYVAWMFNHISYYRVKNSDYYDKMVEYLYDVCSLANFAPSYVLTDFDMLSHVSPSCCQFSSGPIEEPPDVIFKREECALRYFSAFMELARDFWHDYYDIIDNGYLQYLDGLRSRHFDFIVRPEVTDDLIDVLCCKISEKNAIAEVNEYF